MDPISFTVGIVGLAGLFSVCLDVIDKVDSYKDFGLESRSITAQFEADKHLFKKWAHDVGIDKDSSGGNTHDALDNPETKLIVEKILMSIQEIFSKTENIVSTLHPTGEAGPTSFPDGIHFLNALKKPKKSEGAISRRGRIGWSLRSKTRFINQVERFGALVGRLHSLVPPKGSIGQVDVHPGPLSNGLSSRNDGAMWVSDSQKLLSDMKKRFESETRKDLDSWLGASWTNNIYDNFIRRRVDGTCEWILSRQVFLDWVSPDFPSGTAKILWVNGPAGHGKSILCANVIRYLSAVLEAPLAYHFCSSGSETRDPLTIVRSWISQVISCNRDAFELACDTYDIKDGHTASQTEIIELFQSIVHDIPDCTFVVDGLDECTWVEEKWKTDDAKSLTGFFDSIKQAVTHKTARILILSRDEPEIRHGLRTTLIDDVKQGFSEYKICPDDVRSDAMSFSRSVVDKQLTNKSEKLKEELSQRMANRCDGMFLWVKMLEGDLRGGKNKKQLEETIDHAPTALDHLYDRNWMKISHLQDKDRLRVFSILRWAAFSLRPLTILELTEALLIMDDNDFEDILLDELPDTIDEEYVNGELLGLCGSFLDIQKKEPNQDLGSRTIHLAHFSVKQYILCNMSAQGGLLPANEQLRATNEAFQSNIVANMCLRYLNLRNVWQEPLHFESGPVKRPFLDYAAGSWHHHTNENGSNYREVVELINALFSPENKSWEPWKNWFDANNNKSNIPEYQRGYTSTNILFYAALLGLRDTITYLLEEKGLDVNYVDEFQRTAIQAAAAKGQTLIVKLILAKDGDVTVPNIEGWTPLNLASDNGHVDIVKLVLEKGADVTKASNKGWSPLNSASDNGHIEVVKLLLEKGADITNEGWTPLNSASYSGHANVVKLLLEKGADVTNEGWTPLNSASYSGHADVVKLLLENGADVTKANSRGWTPLNSASGNGHIEVVKLLLEKGADITKANNEDSGHIEVVKLLLEKGADVTKANSRGWTPLNSASDSGHIEVVKLLLEKGADITKASNNGWTPLSSASDSGNLDVVEILLEKGADITAGTVSGHIPILSAVEKGHEVIANALLKHSDLSQYTHDVLNNLLYASAYGGCLSLLRLLIEQHEVAYDSIDIQGRNAAHFAALGGNLDILEYLLTKGINPSNIDMQGYGLLHYAASGASFDVVEKVIPFYKADLTRYNTWSPLHWACRRGSPALVKLLLENGLCESPVTTTDPVGHWSPYSIAAFHQNGNILDEPGKDIHGLKDVDLNTKVIGATDANMISMADVSPA
ncbi:hypothetical protein BP5796_03710 [Coleophoma crateriformis]|uniref:Uncharacterized protein n=1 Tax=Coleophoma crateriformis TaxID=565419 RepID=A0A3D8SGB7_9HELO|nr:hypothetical protein BP5796_03710 [Coleophoma crateriformis]